MPQPAITVENLSKAYRIGEKEEVPDTLISAMKNMVRSPFRNFGRLRKLGNIQQGDEDEDILWALRDVSFELNEGEVVGIIGRNGAGKSTLLKVLSRITEPTSGRAVIRGRISSLLEVGTGFHPELTGRENIYMNGTILGMRKTEIDRKFDEIVDFSGVEQFLDTPSKRYSSGMQVRLAFAVAAHLEPEILIIDEVLAVGDIAFQKKCFGKMGEVAGAGRTVIFVSHNMAALESLCSRGIALAGGAIQLDAAMSDTLTFYRNAMLENMSSDNGNAFELAKYFKNVTLQDDSGSPTSILSLGQELHLAISLETRKTVANPRIHIGFNDLLGHRLLTLQTPASSEAIGCIENQATVHCRVPRFPLAPGSYDITVMLMENREQLEKLEGCFTITVDNAEAFGEGRGHLVGTCVAPSAWSVG